MTSVPISSGKRAYSSGLSSPEASPPRGFPASSPFTASSTAPTAFTAPTASSPLTASSPPYLSPSNPSAALDKGRQNWDWLSNVPLDILMQYRPDLRQTQVPGPPPFHPSIDPTAPDPRNPFPTSASNHTAPGPSSSTSPPTHVPASSSSSPPQQALGEDFETVPSRSLSSFPHPDLMQWTYEEAVKNKEGFGKKDCTRMEDGSSIRGSLISTYERIVRHCCAELWSFKIKPEHEGYVQNYSFWKGKYLWLLQRIAKRIEARCPEISWCTDHYKAFKWIEMHVKSECGKRAAVLRDAEKRKAEAGSSSSNKKAKKNNHISNSKVGSDSLSGISSKKVAPLDD
ncbi:hypothetical protein CF326_g9819, partial [Tilletia indica]